MVEASGGRMQDVQGWENWQPSTEDSLKREHLLSIQEGIGKYAHIISEKDFVLAEPAPGRSFYLGDNPVCLANSFDVSPLFSNLGLAVRGIEIYMPLAADLMLCAWCPSILNEISDGHQKGKRSRRAELLARVIAGEIAASDMKHLVAQIEIMERPHDELLRQNAEGVPVSSSDQNMDYYNSIQVSWASRYVICQQGEFALARRFNQENPSLRQGRRMTAA